MNIFRYKYLFLSYWYNFVDTNIFGYSFVLNIFGYSFVLFFFINIFKYSFEFENQNDLSHPGAPGRLKTTPTPLESFQCLCLSVCWYVSSMWILGSPSLGLQKPFAAASKISFALSLFTILCLSYQR